MKKLILFLLLLSTPVYADTDVTRALRIGTPIRQATQGSMIFAGPGGVVSQDNATFYVDDSNNRLGIGNAAPSAVLNVTQASSTTGTDFTQAVDKAGIIITYSRTSGDFTPGIFWNTSNNNATKPKAGIFLQDNSAGSKIIFGTSNTYSTGITNSSNVIDETGRMGIGQTIPTVKLDVNITARNTAYSAADQTTWSDAHIWNPTATLSAATGIAFELGTTYNVNAAGGIAVVKSVGASDNGADMVFITRTQSAASAERMRIISAGNVGIGTTAPDAALEINHATGDNLRLTYNDSNGSAANYTDFEVSSSGDLTITPSGGDVNIVVRIAKRVVTASDATSITPNTDSADITYQANTQATGTLTINADGGTPLNGQSWLLKIKSTNVQTFSWNAGYVGGTTALPTATTGSSQIDYYAFIRDTV